MKKPIQIFLRQCYYSKLQELSNRSRPSWFNKYKAFNNFKNTLDNTIVDYYIIYDEHYGKIENTFLKEEENVKIINFGNECDSFIETMKFVKSKNYSDDTIIYFLEDDYVHRPNWSKILLEGFTLNADYVTLYDHVFFLNDDIFYKIFKTESTHWRVVPATTNTFACKYSTLLEDYEIHEEASLNGYEQNGCSYSRDNDKFWNLHKNHGKYVISCLPGYSTHCQSNFISPFVDWEKIINLNYEDIVSNNRDFKINYK